MSTDAQVPAPGGGAEPGRPPVQLDGEGRPYITLAQLLKREQLAGTGGEAKHLARSGAALVNGVTEARPGRKLHAGDRVQVAGRQLVVQLDAAGPPGQHPRQPPASGARPTGDPGAGQR
jgi:ribosome-associated protein